jgi:hypothetical protein
LTGARGWGNSRGKQKPSYRGSVFANDKEGGPERNKWNLFEAGYTEFEVVGVCDWTAREGGGGGWLGPTTQTDAPWLSFRERIAGGLVVQ